MILSIISQDNVTVRTWWWWVGRGRIYPNCQIIALFVFSTWQQVPWLPVVEVVKTGYDHEIVKWGLGKWKNVNCGKLTYAGTIFNSNSSLLARKM